MKTTELFSKWIKRPEKSVLTSIYKTAVVYTRVSSKEQAENNLSLEFQKKSIEDYARRNDIKIAEYFGGTYESAKTDGRKEFKRMLDYVRVNKKRITIS
jgi:DNA invertase Pin-like site-specific DNA recombinase